MHVRRNDVTGKLMMMSMKYTRLELGIGKTFLNTSFDLYGYLATWTWLVHLWEFMSMGAIDIDISEAVVYHEQRKNDAFIMDVIFRQHISSVE